MKKTIFIFGFLLSCFVFNAAKAQISKYYIRSFGTSGTDGGVALGHDALNQVYSTGYFSGQMAVDSGTYLNSSGSSDIYIIKNDDEGNFIWAKKAGGGGFDRPSAIACLPNGNFFLTGFFSGTAYFGTFTLVSNGIQDFFVAKYNSNGDVLWVKQGGGMFNDFGNSVAVDISGNVFVTGQFSGTAMFDTVTVTSMPDPFTQSASIDIFIIKYDPAGNLLWFKQGASAFTDRGLAVATDPAGSVYVTGQFSDTISFSNSYSNTLYNAIFILKLDASGNEIWFRKIGGGIINIAYALTTDLNGNPMLSGYFKGHPLFFGTTNQTISSIYDYGVFILKMDEYGGLSWIKTFGSDCEVDSKSICLDDSSNIYLAGNFKCKLSEFAGYYGEGTFNSVGFHDMYIAKFNSSGDFEWARNYGGQLEDEVKSVSVNQLYQPVITGSYNERMMFRATNNTEYNFLPSANLYSQNTYFHAYCNEPVTWNLYQVKSIGTQDAFLSKLHNPAIQPPYFYYNYQDTACNRPYIKVEINFGSADYGLNNNELEVCNIAFLTAKTNTSRVSSIGEQNLFSPGPRFKYLWSNGSTDRGITTYQSGIYWVRLTSIDSCFVSTDTISLTVHPLPPRPLITDSQGININDSIVQSVYLCRPDSLTLTASSTVPLILEWYAQSGVIDSNIITISHLNNYLTNPSNITGNYGCWATDSNGCRSVNGIQVSLDSALKFIEPRILLFRNNSPIPIFGDTVRLCEEDLFLGIYDTLQGIPLGYYYCFPDDDFIDYATYNWSISPNVPNYPAFSCNQTRHFEIIVTGWYTVSCEMIRQNNCGPPDTFNLVKSFYAIIDPRPVVIAGITGNNIVCSGDSVLLTTIGGPNYYWYLEPPTGSPVYISDQQQIYASVPGEYWVVVSDTNVFGCYDVAYDYFIVSGSGSIQMMVSPANALICPGDSIQLQVQTSGSYNWYGPNGNLGVNSPTVYATLPGIYYCVADSSGCELLTGEIEISQYGTPFMNVSPSNILCPGATIELSVISSPGSYIQWLPPLSGSSPIKTISTAGTYTCSISSCGITTLASVTIIPSMVDATVSPANPLPFCMGDSVMLTANPGMSFYEWSPDLTYDPILIVHNPGSYFVTTMDNYGCTATSNMVVVASLPAPSPPLVQSNSPVCSGDTLWLSISNISGNQFEWNLPNGQTVQDSLLWIYPSQITDSGTYHAILNNGICSSNATYQVVVDSLLFQSIVVEGTPCMGNPIQISTLAFTGNTYFWLTPEQSPVLGEIINIPSFNIENVGWYLLNITSGSCFYADSVLLADEICDPVMPNIFTPNQDGFNDVFNLEEIDGTFISFEVYDRWGGIVFETSNRNITWNGKKMNSGEDCPEGPYFYLLRLNTANKKTTRKGVIQLIR